MKSKLIFLIGASGAGKTVSARELEKSKIADLEICYFDDIGIPSREEMVSQYESVEEWQRVKTIKAVQDLQKKLLEGKVVILDTQTRPSFIQEACSIVGVENYDVILFDCTDNIRKERLNQRGQPDLAHEEMMNWGRYLREKCIENGYSILDTSELSIEQCTEQLKKMIGVEKENTELIEWGRNK